MWVRWWRIEPRPLSQPQPNEALMAARPSLPGDHRKEHCDCRALPGGNHGAEPMRSIAQSNTAAKCGPVPTASRQGTFARGPQGMRRNRAKHKYPPKRSKAQSRRTRPPVFPQSNVSHGQQGPNSRLSTTSPGLIFLGYPLISNFFGFAFSPLPPFGAPMNRPEKLCTYREASGLLEKVCTYREADQQRSRDLQTTTPVLST
jgi:hypothetical protein